MNIKEIVNIINAELEKGRTFKEIEKDLGFNDRVLAKRLTRRGYKRSSEGSRPFILPDTVKPVTEPIKANKTVKITLEEYNKITELIQLLEPLKTLLNNKNTDVIIAKDLKLKAFRIDSQVLKEWEIFCSNNKQYKVQDLVSTALKEFIESNKK